ncbi:hypothetical protein D3C75_1042050 [compost metagenome]
MYIAKDAVHISHNRFASEQVLYTDITQLLDGYFAGDQITQGGNNLQLRSCCLTQIDDFRNFTSGNRRHRNDNLMDLTFLNNPRNIITVAKNRNTQDLQMKLICTIVNEAQDTGMSKRSPHHLSGDQNSAITSPNDQRVSLRFFTIGTVTAEDSPE